METERPSQLLLVRHAQSTRNDAKKGSIYFPDDEARKTERGIPDHKIPITAAGIIQAEKTGVFLRQRFGAPDYLYHSGYERTIQTANGILKAYTEEELSRIKVRMNLFIRERDSGYAYDMTTAEAESAFPHLDEHWKTFGGFFSRPPGGESIADVVERVYLFLNMLFRDRAGKKVWAVVHGYTLRAIRFVLERWTYDQAMKWPDGQSPRNCGVTVYGYDESERRLILQEYNTICWE